MNNERKHKMQRDIKYITFPSPCTTMDIDILYQHRQLWYYGNSVYSICQFHSLYHPDHSRSNPSMSLLFWYTVDFSRV